MVSLSLVLDFLADERIRATYAAVATATGAPHARVLRTEPEFIQVDQRTAWVVLAAEGYQPPAAKHTPRPADSEIIRDGDDLARRAAEWGRSRTRAAGSTTTASDYGASEPELGDTSAPSRSPLPYRPVRWVHAVRGRQRRILVPAPQRPVRVDPLSRGTEGRTATRTSGTLAVPTTNRPRDPWKYARSVDDVVDWLTVQAQGW